MLLLKTETILQLFLRAGRFDESIGNYNFATNINQAYGDNLKTLGPGVFGIYAGDPNE